ncbi:phosphatidate cytidylyltransferase [Gilvimarinus sp. F26214L]|uniref:phosphatidate cytidylyltransferase n=1 Tax=Gilvimarinus sp. DZF01 TaxID=3461371 RepID=UPI004045ADE7
MLKQRILTAVVLGFGVLAAVFYLPLSVFMLVAALAFLVGAWEWSRLAHFSGGGRVLFALGFAGVFLITGWGLGFLRLPAEMVQNRLAVVAALATLWWAFATWLVGRYPDHATLWSRRWEQTLMGVLVLVPSWAALVFLRGQPGGEWLIVILVASVVCADTGAFFVGRRWGRNKLAPLVSPGKSKEGFYGGFACSALLAIILVLAYGRGVQDWWLLALVVPASLASVMGDLLESMLKRQRGIKDSGSILPGHGGVLDRIDSITAAAPVFALAYALTGWTL